MKRIWHTSRFGGQSEKLHVNESVYICPTFTYMCIHSFKPMYNIKVTENVIDV